MGGKLLIVDDKKVNRFMLSGIFGEQYDIVEAEEGNQAIELIEQEKDEISVILLDIIMPQADGFVVLDYMKEKELLSKIPVILVTINDSNEVIQKAYQYQVADFIQKPFQPDVIKKKVARVITSYEKRLTNV